ncbi:ABC transporter substrate-binding protein [Streptomyces sp. NPDC060194]|uniref:ABC transporter substrate-binding protein n=1 Tax=Streptomyces sp. NPDC060194 TaxID=3347069 RepID=UPI00364FD3FF
MSKGLDRRSFLRMSTGVAAAATASGALTACGLGGAGRSTGDKAASGPGGGKPAGDVTLAWWGADERHTRTQKVLRLFEQQHSGVTAKGEFGGFQGYFDKLATRTAGGNAPDIFQILVEYVPEYAGRNALADLGPYEGKGLDLSDVDKASVDGGRIGGKLVAVSFGDNTPAVYFDRTTVEGLGLKVPEPGWTWEDFESLAGNVTRKSKGKVYGAHDFSGVNYALEIWLRQRGLEMYDEKGGLGFQRADLEEWFAFWAGLRKEKILVPPDVHALFKGNNADIPMMKGVCANFVNWPNLLPGLQAATKKQLALTTPPKASDQKRPGAYVKAVNWVAVYAKSPNKDASVALLDFLVNDVEAGKVLGVDRGAPPSAKVREAVKPGLPAPEKAFLDYLETASQEVTPQTIAVPKGAGTIYAELIKAAEDIGFGRASISEGVDRLYAEAERALR